MRRRQFCERLVALYDVEDGKRGAFEYMEWTLDKLDSKAASLLQFNALVSGVFLILWQGLHASGQGEVAVFVAGLAILGVSTLLGLSIVWVHWVNARDLEDIATYLLRITQVRDVRTTRYRAAWIMSVLGFFLFMVALGLGFADLTKGQVS
ncbi:MAG TPA: hypothetical protein VG841_11205 [Caulobacterales bacterium]|nr:hypothetical protein [Caulobacterales bacterium]